MTADFDQNDWIKRLSRSLGSLEAAQRPFLDWHFSASGYTRIIRNGQDETPYPSEALYKLYNDALFEARYRSTGRFRALKAALDPVRGVLRDHPTLTRALGRDLECDDFQVGILNHSSMTTLSQLIVGLMEQQGTGSTNPFHKPVSDLCALLKLALGRTPPQRGKELLSSAVDAAVFYGVRLKDEIDLGEGYALMPFERLTYYVERDWLQEVAAEQVSWRRLEKIFGIVRRFSWKPTIKNLHIPPNTQPRLPPPLFHRWTGEFANLLSVSLSQRVSWLATFEGCIPRGASGLLGSLDGAAQTHKGRSVSHLFSAFEEIRTIESSEIQVIQDIFARRRETEYPELAPIVHRLAEAHRRDGQFSVDDKILDLAIVFERLFKPRGRSISRELEKAASDLLANNDTENATIREKIRHFYKVRSAIIHGPSDERSRRLIRQSEQAWSVGERIAREAILKRIS